MSETANRAVFNSAAGHPKKIKDSGNNKKHKKENKQNTRSAISYFGSADVITIWAFDFHKFRIKKTFEGHNRFIALAELPPFGVITTLKGLLIVARFRSIYVNL